MTIQQESKVNYHNTYGSIFWAILIQPSRVAIQFHVLVITVLSVQKFPSQQTLTNSNIPNFVITKYVAS